MIRDPFNDPREGDTLYSTRFGGARIHVRRRFVRPGWGQAVSVRIDPDELRSVKQRFRTWSLATWRAFATGGEITRGD